MKNQTTPEQKPRAPRTEKLLISRPVQRVEFDRPIWTGLQLGIGFIFAPIVIALLLVVLGGLLDGIVTALTGGG